MRDKRLTGKFEIPQQQYTGNRPPLIETEVNAVLTLWMEKNSLPEFMPRSLADEWWLNMMEPAQPDEVPRQVPLNSGEGSRWICPYHNRVLHSLSIFLRRPASEQRVIVAAREDGIFWRGDSIIFFMRVVDETTQMRKVGVENYRLESLRRMGKLLGSMGGGDGPCAEAIAEREATQQE